MVTLKHADAVTGDVPAARRLVSTLLMTMRALSAALLLVAMSCGYGLPVAPPGQNGESRISWMSARVEGEPWTTDFVSVQRHDAYLVLEGTKWLDFEATLVIRLVIRAEVGTAQAIDSSSIITADVRYVPVYTEAQGWTASRTTGSGTFRVTSLSETGATGTFSFTAQALTATTLLQSYRVTDGSFDVRF